MKVYFDESGNTGQNLLDCFQPIYVLSSNNFNDNEVKELLKPLTNNGLELHFKQIKKYTKYQKQLIEVFNHELIDSERIKISYADKKFVLVCHIVDQMIESVYYDLGLDIYKKGLNIAFANIIYTLGVSYWNSNLFNCFLNNFLILIREPSDDNIENFYNSALNLSASISEQEKILIEPIIYSRNQIKEILSCHTKYSIDLSLPTFAVLCDWWGKQIKDKFDIVHDESKQIDFWKEYIDFIISITINDPMEVGFDYRKMNYPLAINSLVLDDSKSCKQIQFSDLVSSSMNYCIKKIHIEKNFNDKFANALFSSKITSIISHPLMPSSKITPKELGTENDNGINPLDYLANLKFKHREEFDKIMKKILRK